MALEAIIDRNGDFRTKKYINTIIPAITDGLRAHFPCDSEIGINYRNRRNMNYEDDWADMLCSPWALNGGAEENRIVIDDNPFGDHVPVWEASGNDTASNSDGGWTHPGNYFPIDNTKTYRFSTWVRRKVAGNGTFYLGLYQSDDSGGINTMILGGGETGNPYFWTSNMNSWENEWLLVVGHVRPHDHSETTLHPDSGVYDIYGTKVSGILYDFKWNPLAKYATLRSYLYYSTIPETVQQWWGVNVEVCDGTEPTLNDLLHGTEDIYQPYATDGLAITEDGIHMDDGFENKFMFPYFNTGETSGGWSHWGSTGHIGTYGVSTDPKYMYDPEKGSCHWVKTDPLSPVPYLVYLGPSTGGVEKSRAASFIVCMEDFSDIVGTTQIYPAWNANVNGYAIPNVWTSVKKIGNGPFHLCTVDNIRQDGTNDLVGVYVRPGYTVYFSAACCVNDQIIAPFPTATRAPGHLIIKEFLNPGKGTILVDVTFKEDNSFNNGSSDQYSFGNTVVWNGAGALYFHDQSQVYINNDDGARNTRYLIDPIVRNQRTKIAIVYDDSDGTFEIYKNGVLNMTTTGKISNMIGKLQNLDRDWSHSGHMGTTGYKMSQIIHGITSYDKVLSAEEIYELHSGKLQVTDRFIHMNRRMERYVPDDCIYLPLDGSDRNLKGMVDGYVDYIPDEHDTDMGTYVGQNDQNMYPSDFGSFQVVSTSGTVSARDATEDYGYFNGNTIFEITKSADTYAASDSFRTCEASTAGNTYCISFKAKLIEAANPNHTLNDVLAFHFNGGRESTFNGHSRYLGDGWYETWYINNATSGTLCAGIGLVGPACKILVTDIQKTEASVPVPFRKGGTVRSGPGEIRLNCPDIINENSSFTVIVDALPHRDLFKNAVPQVRINVLEVGNYYTANQADASIGFNWGGETTGTDINMRGMQLIGYVNKVGKFGPQLVNSEVFTEDEVKNWIMFVLRYDHQTDLMEAIAYTRTRKLVSAQTTPMTGLTGNIRVGGYAWDTTAWRGYVRDLIIAPRKISDNELAELKNKQLEISDIGTHIRGNIYSQEVVLVE